MSFDASRSRSSRTASFAASWHRLITVCRSHGRDTTKGGHADVIPIAIELLPYLRSAIDTSPSALVFPREDGTMMRPDVDLEGRDLRPAIEFHDHLVLVDGDVPGDDGEDFLLQHGREIGAPGQRPLVGQQDLQPIPGDRRRAVAHEELQEAHAAVAFRPKSRLMNPCRGGRASTATTSSPMSRRAASV